MLSTIWDDINQEVEAIVIDDNFEYSVDSLTNEVYELADDPVKYRLLLSQNKVRGQYQDLAHIRTHQNRLFTNERVRQVIDDLFRVEKSIDISLTDYVFINAYYRRILRARLERDYKGKELPKGLIITNHANSEVDAAIVTTLRLLRILCGFLGIESTTTASSFPRTKLRSIGFWLDISGHFISVFGETRVSPLTFSEYFTDSEFPLIEADIIIFLDMIFSIWSGSILTLSEEMVTIVPATYVVRLLPQLE